MAGLVNILQALLARIGEGLGYEPSETLEPTSARDRHGLRGLRPGSLKPTPEHVYLFDAGTGLRLS